MEQKPGPRIAGIGGAGLLAAVLSMGGPHAEPPADKQPMESAITENMPPPNSTTVDRLTGFFLTYGARGPSCYDGAMSATKSLKAKELLPPYAGLRADRVAVSSDACSVDAVGCFSAACPGVWRQINIPA